MGRTGFEKLQIWAATNPLESLKHRQSLTNKLNEKNNRPHFSITKEKCTKHPLCKEGYLINEKYICWECVKEEFSSNYTIENFASMITITTFRTQKSENWIGARSAFERSLVEASINWFVYVKLFLVKGKSRPLVVGKSGSKLVNTSGSDIKFSTILDGGTSKRYLLEN